MKKFVLLFLLTVSNIFYAQSDCSTALSVCGNATITYGPTGVGAVSETIGGCITSGEHNSIWYKITIAVGGTLTFDLAPTDPNADYDWAIFGPNAVCGSLGSPIRCNAATVIGVGANTGLNMTSTLTTAAGGSLTPYCQYMTVNAGETYYLFLDNWVGAASTTVAPFSLTWGGTAVLASPFTNPTLQPYPFVAPGNPAANPADPREVLICINPAVFDFSTLSAGILNSNPNFVITYHTSQNDALSGASPITTPILVNTTSTYFYSIHYQDPANPTNPMNYCRQVGSFKFKLGSISAQDASLESCALATNVNSATFNLTLANVTSQAGAIITYYGSLANAQTNTNPIATPTAYVSGSGIVYVRVSDAAGCYTIVKITLTITPPVYSTVLKDQTICIDERATIDAGPGFVSYLWSTGATTQVISGVPVGSYWVKLQSGNCFAIQSVNVFPYVQPVVESIDISFEKITVNVKGGNPPYKFSLDGVNWQDSNVFTGVKRGQHIVHVKDSNDCQEVEIEVTVPNIVNVITPNGDGSNDYVDYSVLAYKKNLVFTVYDRYGNEIFKADHFNDYKWDGTSGNKKILTGNYWYSITWNEPTGNAPVKYSGWILVKNRN